jgi:predicted methyltransferase
LHCNFTIICDGAAVYRENVHARQHLRALLVWCLAALAVALLDPLRGRPGAGLRGRSRPADRSDADRQTDKRRDALKLLTFIGPKSGWTVLDMGADAGFSTELMARTVARGRQGVRPERQDNEKFEARRASPGMANAVSWIHPYNDPAAGRRRST